MFAFLQGPSYQIGMSSIIWGVQPSHGDLFPCFSWCAGLCLRSPKVKNVWVLPCGPPFSLVQHTMSKHISLEGHLHVFWENAPK